MTDSTRWKTEEAFYDADTRREHSREIDFGGTWHDPTGGHWRLSYIVSTGDLVFVRAGRVPEHALHGAENYAVELVGWVPSVEACEKLLNGWRREISGITGVGMRWVRDRVRRGAVAAGSVGENHRRRTHAEQIGATGGTEQLGLL